MNIYIINLSKDTQRRAFQEQQLHDLRLSHRIVQATTTEDIAPLYQECKDNWQRPLRQVEIACYFSHQKLWKKILQEQKPALILEDDILICKELPQILEFCKELKNIDHISLESTARKKLLGNKSISTPLNEFKLSPLLIDRNGAGGYILFPSGAKKLLEHEKKYGVALADAQITSCFNLNSYQLEPACMIQMDQCSKYGLKPPIKVNSNISAVKKESIESKKILYFKRKRIAHQLKLALRELWYILRAKRRKIDISSSLKALYGES